MSDRFLEALHKEKLASQARRGDLIVRKLSWVTGLLAAGSLRIENSFSFALLLYVAPFVASVFDLYITGENYGIKRMGVFVRRRFKRKWERQWELRLRNRRDPFSLVALPLSSLIVLSACAVLSWPTPEATSATLSAFYVWLFGNTVTIRLVFVIGVLRLESLEEPAPRWRDVFSRFWGLQTRQTATPL